MGTPVMKKTMKKMAAVVSGGVLALSAVASVAQQKAGLSVSANVALTSDYRFRGISQTDGPAIQGGFNVDFGNGFYIGTWGSNVSFANSLELDYYGGYSGSFGESLEYDVGYIFYDYPETPDDDPYQEVYGSLSFANATVGLAYSDDYYLESGEFFYLYGDYSFPIGPASLDLHAGLNSFDEEAFICGDDATCSEDSYLDFSISLSWGLKAADLSLSVVGTNLDDEPVCGRELCDTAVVLGLSKSL